MKHETESPENPTKACLEAKEELKKFFLDILRQCAAKRIHVFLWYSHRPGGKCHPEETISGFVTTVGQARLPTRVLHDLMLGNALNLVGHPFPEEHLVDDLTKVDALPCRYCYTPAARCANGDVCCSGCTHETSRTEPAPPPEEVTETTNDVPVQGDA